MSFFKDLVVADWSQHSTLLHSDPVPHVHAEYEQSRSCFGLKKHCQKVKLPTMDEMREDFKMWIKM